MFIFQGLFLGDCDARQVIKGVFPSGRLSICTHWQNEFYEDGVCRILWKPNHPLQEAGHQTSFLVFTKASDKAAQPVAVYRSHVVSPILILQGNYWARHFFSALNILLNYVTLCIMEQKLEFNNIITRLYIDKHMYCREQTKNFWKWKKGYCWACRSLFCDPPMGEWECKCHSELMNCLPSWLVK